MRFPHRQNKKIKADAIFPSPPAELIHGRTVNRHGTETLRGAVTADFSDTDILVLRQTKAAIGPAFLLLSYFELER